jgi:hypothetical protein
MSKTVAELTAAIEKEKAAFNVSRARLASLIAPLMAKHGAEDIFIAHAYENGADFTLNDTLRDPGYFDIGSAPDRAMMQKLAEPLKRANDAHGMVIDLVAERENELMAKDPSHKPTYFWMGREFTIDPAMQTVTYLDTGVVHAFVREDERPRADGPSRDRCR